MLKFILMLILNLFWGKTYANEKDSADRFLKRSLVVYDLQKQAILRSRKELQSVVEKIYKLQKADNLSIPIEIVNDSVIAYTVDFEVPSDKQLILTSYHPTIYLDACKKGSKQFLHLFSQIDSIIRKKDVTVEMKTLALIASDGYKPEKIKFDNYDLIKQACRSQLDLKQASILNSILEHPKIIELFKQNLILWNRNYYKDEFQFLISDSSLILSGEIKSFSKSKNHQHAVVVLTVTQPSIESSVLAIYKNEIDNTVFLSLKSSNFFPMVLKDVVKNRNNIDFILQVESNKYDKELDYISKIGTFPYMFCPFDVYSQSLEH